MSVADRLRYNPVQKVEKILLAVVAFGKKLYFCTAPCTDTETKKATNLNL